LVERLSDDDVVGVVRSVIVRGIHMRFHHVTRSRRVLRDPAMRG